MWGLLLRLFLSLVLDELTAFELSFATLVRPDNPSLLCCCFFGNDEITKTRRRRIERKKKIVSS